MKEIPNVQIFPYPSILTTLEYRTEENENPQEERSQRPKPSSIALQWHPSLPISPVFVTRPVIGQNRRKRPQKQVISPKYYIHSRFYQRHVGKERYHRVSYRLWHWHSRGKSLPRRAGPPSDPDGRRDSIRHCLAFQPGSPTWCLTLSAINQPHLLVWASSNMESWHFLKISF